MVNGIDLSEFFRGMGEAKEVAVRAALDATNKAAQHVLGDAQQLAPVGGPPYSKYDPAPGTLQSSGVALPAEAEGYKISAVIGFNTRYAAVQHEQLEFRHSHGQAKYLETAIRRNQEKVKQMIADAIKGALKG
ncbi:MAG TPA: hypothetical protein VGG19_12285 [Tepidisphaeraceae bacterium]|jgi:hypothetical protein